MAKKIYDILPPKIAHKIEDSIKDFMGDDKKSKRRGRRKKEVKNLFRPLLIIAGIVLLIAAVYLFFKLPKANVEIWPKTEVLSFKQTLTIDKETDSIDLAKAVIPAQYLEEEKSGQEEFLSTGNASNEGKATGKIIIYNKIDPATTFTLKTGTHFLSDSGKYFLTLQKVVIPAAKKSKGKITPGSIEVKVEAAEGGESFNIKPAKFVVPKLFGTSSYYSIYAESKDPMVGGFAGKIKKVTDDDIQAAKDSLTKKLLAEAESALRNRISSDYMLPDNAILSETTEASSLAKSGAVADKFRYQAKVKISALAFKKSDLEKFAKDYIISLMPESKTMLDKSLDTTYVLQTVDMEDKKAALNIEFSAKIYDALDKNSLAPLFRNKTSSQINEIISDSLGDKISKVKINLWPFWVEKAPKSQKAINVELKFE